MSPRESNVWAIVLSGGNDERLRPFVKRWRGRPIPKQYCAFTGSRSLFQRTVDGLDGLVEPRRRISVIARDHREEVRAQWGSRDPGRVIEQPRNCGTAAGVFLGLAHVRALEPDATVLVVPSDHFVEPEDRFAGHLLRASRAAEWLEDRVVVFGARALGPESGYGWLIPGGSFRRGAVELNAVRAFLQKPGHRATRWAFDAGGLWSTMILVGRVDALWRLGREHAHDVLDPFEWLVVALGTPDEARALSSIYEHLPSCDLSAHVLERAPERLAIAHLSGVDWSDWGTAPRIAATLRRLGREPAFPSELLAGADVRTGLAGRRGGSRRPADLRARPREA